MRVVCIWRVSWDEDGYAESTTYEQDLDDGVVLNPGTITDVLGPPNVKLRKVGAVHTAEDAKQKEGEQLEEMPVLFQRSVAACGISKLAMPCRR